MKLERIVPIKRRSIGLLHADRAGVASIARAWLLAVVVASSVIGLADSSNLVDALAFRTDNLVVTTNITMTGATFTGFPTTTCGAGFAMQTVASTGIGTCVAVGTSTLTNSAGANVAVMSNGTNLVATSGATISVGRFKGTVQRSTVTGTQNDFVLTYTAPGTTNLFWAGASVATFNNFKCGAVNCDVTNDGDELFISSQNAGMVLSYLSASGTPANRINMPGATKIVLNNGGGAHLVYDGTNLWWTVVSAWSDRIDAPLNLVGALTAATASFTGSVTIGNAGQTQIFNTATSGLTANHGTLSADASNFSGRITAVGANQTVTLTLASGGYANTSHCFPVVESAGAGIGELITVTASKTAPVFNCIDSTTGAGANCPDFSYQCTGR